VGAGDVGYPCFAWAEEIAANVKLDKNAVARFLSKSKDSAAGEALDVETDTTGLRAMLSRTQEVLIRY